MINEQFLIEHPVQQVPLGLPKVINSLCPDCKKVIKARILEEEGKIVMRKKCKEHGECFDIIYNHAELYKKIERWTFEDAPGLTNPKIKNATRCPQQCGLCNMHISRACLTNIDLTNRCNLRCPICFANANVKGYVYELTLDQVKEMLLEIKRQNYPLGTHVVQFSGGEPTIHPKFIECVKAARNLGFDHIQIASNGITIADSLEFAKECKKAGLYTVYMQFDGIGDSAYKSTRGVPLWETKKKAIENCRKAGLKVVLVPTLVKTINDAQVGKILQFAIDNSDVVSGISYQPVAFTGRISEKRRLKLRYTLSDLAFDIESQTGYAKAMEDWYPLSITSPYSKLMSKIWGELTINISCHSNCGIGTYLLINSKTKQVIPITRVLNVESLFTNLNEFIKSNKVNFSPYLKFMFIYMAKKSIKKSKENINSLDIYKILFNVIQKKQATDWRIMFVAGMHFQDKFNYNIDRVKRCVIHYSAPNGLIYPFCSYNSGLVFRERIEKKYSVPLEQWKKKRGNQYVISGFYKGE